MPDHQEPASPEQAKLAEYQVWDRVEGRLWSRARLILLAAVVLVVLLGLLGLPLIEERIDRRVTARAERLIAERVAAVQVDIPELRQEIRSETHYQKEELLKLQFELEKEVAALLERTAEIQESTAAFQQGAAEFATFKSQLRAIQQTWQNEEQRLHKLRTTHEKDLSAFRAESQELAQQVPRMAARELKHVEAIVDRDLDELRLVVSDFYAGSPAIFSTFVDMDRRIAQLTGLNFGEERGVVFLRVRSFRPGAQIPFTESDSIRLQVSEWTPTRVELRIPAPALERIQEAKLEAGERSVSGSDHRYGFLIQATNGKMSRWSALRADSLIPPTTQTPKEE